MLTGLENSVGEAVLIIVNFSDEGSGCVAAFVGVIADDELFIF